MFPATVMTTPDRHRYLVRFAGDLGTKRGRALIQFRNRLARNLRDALRAEGFQNEVETTRGRLYVTADGEGAADVVARVFGIQSLSPVRFRPVHRLEDILDAGQELFTEAVRDRTFAVRARRSSVRERVDFTSVELERQLGTRLYDASAGVDLSTPDVTVRVEITKSGTHFFDEIRPGPGGLPIGCEGRALVLVSGGIDSIAAAWLLLKRGVEVDYLFYNLGDDEHFRQVLEIVQILARRWSYGSQPRLWTVRLQRLSVALRQRCDPRLWQVLLKRLMVHGANELLETSGSAALVTGESLGQVSSQTLDNLCVIEEASRVPILRPLIGFDKLEIIDLARRIGTFDLSAKVHEYCALQGRGPSVAAPLDDLLENEARMDLDVLRGEVRAAEPLDLRAPPGATVTATPSSSGLALNRVPEDCTVIDLRAAGAFDRWHYPGAVRLDYVPALQAAANLSADNRYLVCCEVEFKSAHVAEALRDAGREAFYFKGGTSQLMRYAADREMVDFSSIAPAVRE